MQGNRPLVLLLTLLGLSAVLYTLRHIEEDPGPAPSGVPSRIVMVNGYPEFHVDNKPFFMHSAAFYYYRMPRDRWEESLQELKEHGINTIDLYIIWNWHQPVEDQLDLDGRTNPRRDLTGLLRLIDGMGFKLSVRPGPFICSEWKNGGYPDWLLENPDFNRALRPEHQMPLKDILEGRYPRLSALQYEYSEEAAAAYLGNPLHLRYTRKWYEDVMQVVRPYLASRGGNVIMLQIDDDQALDKYNYNGPRFWQYMNLLRRYLVEAAGDESVPVYFNPADMRVTAASSAPEGGPPLWAMGQFYQEEGFGADVMKAEDSSHAKYLTEILKTQPGFPPYFIEYQAGWFAGAEDVRARGTDPSNTLLSSRFLFQNGVKGINYFPLQDTLFPAGYECPWSNYFYSWESAIGFEGDRRARAEASLRNGRLIQGMGSVLAATHYVADIGIVHSIGTYPQERLTQEDITGLVFRTMTATQMSLFNQLNAELVDPDFQNTQHLLRYPVVLLPAAGDSTYRDGKAPAYLEFSARAQSVLIEYVRQGGTLLAYPTPPAGQYMNELFPVRPEGLSEPAGSMTSLSIGGTTAASPGALHLYPSALHTGGVTPLVTVAGDPRQVVGYLHKHGAGSVIVLGAEFDRWVPLRSATSTLDRSLPLQPALTEDERRQTGVLLESILDAAGVRRSVFAAGLDRGVPAQQPYLSMLASNASTESGKNHAYGFLSITNFGSSPHSVQPVVRDPRTDEDLELPTLTVAGRDALMLPIRLGLKEFGLRSPDGNSTSDEIYYSTAEVTSVRAAGGELVIDLYSRGKSSLRLRLNRPPAEAPSVEGETIEQRYYPATRLLDLDIPPPRDSSGRQTLRIPYPVPDSEAPKVQETRRRPVGIGPGIRLPVRHDVAYELFPATRVAASGEPMEFSFTHPPDCTGRCNATVNARDLTVSKIEAEKNPAFTLTAPYQRTYIRRIEWALENNGRRYDGTGEVVFLAPGSAVALERDVDRDGFRDYILENEKVRLVISPHAGARSFAFVRKDTGTSAFTSIGGMRDLFAVELPDPPGQDRLPAWTRHGSPGMHNRPYVARITRDSGEFAEVMFSYQAPDVAPKGALLERTVRLTGGSDFVDVTYKITPEDPQGDQGYINLSSIALGTMEDENATVLRSDRSAEVVLRKQGRGTIAQAAWIALATRDGRDLFGISWIPGAFADVRYERRDYSLLLGLASAPWRPGERSHTYKVRYVYASDNAQTRLALTSGPQ